MMRDDDLEIEDQLFKHISSASFVLMKRIAESSKIYSVMYQLAESCLTNKFVRSAIIDDQKKLFASIRSDLDSADFKSYLEYFVFVFKISTRQSHRGRSAG